MRGGPHRAGVHAPALICSNILSMSSPVHTTQAQYMHHQAVIYSEWHCSAVLSGIALHVCVCEAFGGVTP